ncbi:MAG: hypothetical protein ACRDBM_18160 [Sporomusa sp.]
MVRISNLSWISQDAMEAEITITDGVYELVCFSQPCNFIKGQQISEPIHCMNNTNVVRSKNKEYYIGKLKGVFDYNITAKLIDENCGLVKIGKIIIELEKGSLPGDIEENEYLNFDCQRLDIY